MTVQYFHTVDVRKLKQVAPEALKNSHAAKFAEMVSGGRRNDNEMNTNACMYHS